MKGLNRKVCQQKWNFPFFPLSLPLSLATYLITVEMGAQIDRFQVELKIGVRSSEWAYTNRTVLTEFQRLSATKITIKSNPWNRKAEKSRLASLLLLMVGGLSVVGTSIWLNLSLNMDSNVMKTFNFGADSSQLFFSFSILWGFKDCACVCFEQRERAREREWMYRLFLTGS